MFDRVDIWLLITLFLPAVGALLAWALDSRGHRVVRQSALVTTLVTFVLSAILISKFEVGDSAFGLYEYSWLGQVTPVKFSIGLDGLSLWMFGLTALLSISAVLVSWNTITEKPGRFYALLLVLQTCLFGVFAARDVILFYTFFEFSLLPLLFLIGIWGGNERKRAALTYFLYNFAGSLLTLLGMLAVVLWHHSATGVMTFSIPELTAYFADSANRIPNDAAHGYLQFWIFLALFAGFAVKIPLFPFHSWLPLVHSQTPTAGSIELGGLLLKVGAYGFIRFCFGFVPDATAMAAPWLVWLALIAVIYGALIALAQSDMKRFLAYSGLSHVGLIMLGVFVFNRIGMQGGVLQMVNHGLSAAGLFAIVGMLYERFGSRKIREYGGLARRAPVLTTFALLFAFSSIGLPGLNGFVGEFLILNGTFQRAYTGVSTLLSCQYMTISVLAVFGVVLGAWYMLWFVQQIFWGPVREPSPDADHRPNLGQSKGSDASGREIAALLPLVVVIFWIGLYPNYFLSRIAPAVDPLADRVATSFDQQQILVTIDAETPAATSPTASVPE